MDEYLDLQRELKKLWNVKVTVIPVIEGAVGIVLKNMEKRLVENGDQRKNQYHPNHNNVKNQREY